eukprot:jgi/Astpho2/7945/Aster-06545
MYAWISDSVSVSKCTVVLSTNVSLGRDQDSTTTKLSDGGHSLQLDWQLRSKVGLQLLFKRKVGSTGVPMRAAVEDLRGRTEAVIAIINLHRLLHGVKACLLSHVLPVDYVFVRQY